ncbi:hypothetical protein SeMB42_g04137 [Synchytrium endobioticum]|uniref:Uncharacterized protein n=1 Tax=Synchytrium endobioticum TaxID=286115 RepID=A0A507D0T7_9FUNG|nr:hypothetical protein SeMB42_g04137 [Synchytrium endobioticum]
MRRSSPSPYRSIGWVKGQAPVPLRRQAAPCRHTLAQSPSRFQVQGIQLDISYLLQELFRAPEGNKTKSSSACYKGEGRRQTGPHAGKKYLEPSLYETSLEAVLQYNDI